MESYCLFSTTAAALTGTATGLAAVTERKPITGARAKMENFIVAEGDVSGFELRKVVWVCRFRLLGRRVDIAVMLSVDYRELSGFARSLYRLCCSSKLRNTQEMDTFLAVAMTIPGGLQCPARLGGLPVHGQTSCRRGCFLGRIPVEGNIVMPFVS